MQSLFQQLPDPYKEGGNITISVVQTNNKSLGRKMFPFLMNDWPIGLRHLLHNISLENAEQEVIIGVSPSRSFLPHIKSRAHITFDLLTIIRHGTSNIGLQDFLLAGFPKYLSLDAVIQLLGKSQHNQLLVVSGQNMGLERWKRERIGIMFMDVFRILSRADINALEVFLFMTMTVTAASGFLLEIFGFQKAQFGFFM